MINFEKSDALPILQRNVQMIEETTINKAALCL